MSSRVGGLGRRQQPNQNYFEIKKGVKIALFEDLKTKGAGKQSFFSNNSIFWPIIKTYGKAKFLAIK